MITETIESIDEGKILEFKGVNLIVTGSIGKNAIVTIINGSVWVKGSIESNAQIEVTTDTIIEPNRQTQTTREAPKTINVVHTGPIGCVSGNNFGDVNVRGGSPSRNPVRIGTTTIYSQAIGSIYGDNFGSISETNYYSAPQINRAPLPQAIGSIYGNNYGSIRVNSYENGSQQVKTHLSMDSIGSLTVDGDIGENANIRSFNEINIKGDVKSNATIKGVSCNITAKNIDSGVKVKAKMARIECSKLGEKAILSAKNAEFHCDEVFPGVKIKAKIGTIVAKVVHENASLSLINGSIQINEAAHASANLNMVFGSIEIAGVDYQKSRPKHMPNQPVSAEPDNKPTATPSNDKKSKNPVIAFIGSLFSSKKSDQPSPEPEAKTYSYNK